MSKSIGQVAFDTAVAVILKDAGVRATEHVSHLNNQAADMSRDLRTAVEELQSGVVEDDNNLRLTLTDSVPEAETTSKEAGRTASSKQLKSVANAARRQKAS